MHLFIAFDGADAREIPVSDVTTVRLEDGITGGLVDLFALDGVRGLYLVRTDGEPTMTGDGPAAEQGITPQELARSIGWVAPEEKQNLVDRVAQLEAELGVQRRAVEQLTSEAARLEQQERAGRGLFGKRS